MRIGLWDRSTSGWHTGSEYTRTLGMSLKLALDDPTAQLVLIASHDGQRNTEGRGIEVPIVTPPVIREWLNLEQRIRKRIPALLPLAGDVRLRQWRIWAQENRLDAVLLFDPPAWWEPIGPGVCSWIPDLQHVHFPHYFEEWERTSREAHYRRITRVADTVLLSSRTMLAEFSRYAPESAHKGRIFRFPSRFVFGKQCSPSDSGEVLRRYGIRSDFFLVVNQFWRHKNHGLVLDALRVLREQENCPQVVMIGQPTDSRDPSGQYLSRLLGRMAELGLEGQVKILGFVPAEHRDALLHACKALVQPSECEGWNSSVVDAKALGRPVIASDIPVHREQVPSAFGLFGVDDSEGLAMILRAAAADLPPGPDPETEASSLERAMREADSERKALLSVCEDTVRLGDARRGRR